jgi:hypothetical protein
VTKKQFDALLESSISDMQNSLTTYSSNISAIVAEALENPSRDAAFWKTVTAKIDAEYAAMQASMMQWADKTIPSQFKAFLKDIQEQSKGFLTFAKQSISELVSADATTQVVGALIQDAITGYAAALTAGKAEIEHLLRKTQQMIIDEFLVDKTVAEAYQSGNLRNFKKLLAAASPEFQAILDAVKDGAVIKAGRYHYKPGYYAEMVARVKWHEAQSQAALMQATNYGTDLLKVSSHNTTTAICIPHEGKIYSISGTSKVYPALQAMTPFHVNCQHLMFPEFAAAYGIDGKSKTSFEEDVASIVGVA